MIHVAEIHDGADIYAAMLVTRPNTAVRMVKGEPAIVGYEVSSAGGCTMSDITRHAPLPDFGAMARELEELRARVPAVCECVTGNDVGGACPDPVCPDCGGSGAVLVKP